MTPDSAPLSLSSGAKTPSLFPHLRAVCPSPPEREWFISSNLKCLGDSICKGAISILSASVSALLPSGQRPQMPQARLLCAPRSAEDVWLRLQGLTPWVLYLSEHCHWGRAPPRHTSGPSSTQTRPILVQQYRYSTLGFRPRTLC